MPRRAIPSLLALVAVLAFTGLLHAQAEPGKIASFSPPYPAWGSVERLDPAMDDVVPVGAKLEKLAEGFRWSEGPAWSAAGRFLLFCDVPCNVLYTWRDGEGVKPFLQPSGYDGPPHPRASGANGTTIDARGRLIVCEHGNRRLVRLDSLQNPRGSRTVLAERFEGKRFNSPNDVVVHPVTGEIYFTDPPYGLIDEKLREIPFHGVYRLGRDGKVTLLTKELERPNGLAFSADGRKFYLANSHEPRPIVQAFDVNPDGTLANSRLFFDTTKLITAARPGLPDGVKVDARGHVFVTAAGGVLVLSPDGRHLGTIVTGEPTGNCAFGDDGRTLYITANHALARIRLK